MLDVMRSNVKTSLPIVLIFGALIFVFVFSFGRGSQGFKTHGSESWAARVNGDVITATDFQQAYSSRFRQMSQLRGGKYTTDNARQENLKAETLRALVDQELIAQQASALGVQVSDADVADAIAKNPNFQQEGKFEFDYYKRLVENGYGMSVPRFEALVRRDLLRTRVLQAALSGAQASDEEVKAQWIAQHESAAIAYVKFTAFMFGEQAQASDAEVEAWLKDHSAEAQKKYQDDLKLRWTQAAGQKVRAIRVPLAPGATADDEKTARARIDVAAAEVKGGKDFAEVARARSEDAATKDKGGELGWVSKGGSAYGRTLEEEAAKLKAGQVSGVFKDRSGFWLVKVEELRPESVQPFDAVKKQVAADLLKADKAKALAKQKAEATLAALKGGKQLGELYPAKKSEPGQFDFAALLSPQTSETEPFHPAGGFVPGLGQAPRLSEAVFAQPRAGGIPDAPIEEGDTWYVFKVTKRERAVPSSMTAADREQARDRLEQQRQGELYTAWIERLRKDGRIEENGGVLSYDSAPAGSNFEADDF